jgi:hypothetical protein
MHHQMWGVSVSLKHLMLCVVVYMPPVKNTPRTTLVAIRVSPSERRQLHEWAATKEETLSDLIRWGLLAQGFRRSSP